MGNNVVLSVVHLKKYFPLHRGLLASLTARGREYVRAVDDISFNVYEKEIVGFVGESGCGKSTMSRAILRLIEPSSGEVHYEDAELSSLKRKQLKSARRRMQMIFQDPHGSLNPRRTVADILRQTVRIHKLATGERAENELIKNTLEEVELRPADRFWDR
jgi:ABC-type oligopeptide transport system ATPase subunit